MTDYNKDRLGALVSMARKGTGNEQQIAIRKVKALCKKHELDFDEVMGQGEQVYEYSIKYRSKGEEDVLSQTAWRYAVIKESDGIYKNKYRKVIIFRTTKSRYVETLNAWEVLKRAYSKEKKRSEEALLYGFIEKHGLYYNPTLEEARKREDHVETQEEMTARLMGSRMAGYMDDVDILKRISSPKKV